MVFEYPIVNGKTYKFKDPIYGYIEVEGNVVSNIIDTACFQRLRNIVQTSYSPLYPSALHNRFVHSIGVYHLGKLVANTLLNDKEKYADIDDLHRYLDIFVKACLLHDVGHAPFSHTGERYYLGKDGSRSGLHREIINLTGDIDLDDEIQSKNYKAAPHELMSVIVALKEFSYLFKNNEERSFFARCITGYTYATKIDKNNEHSNLPLYSFLNCLISFLNSSVIDVDKLDYLIRDAYITGFETVKIDYYRLLSNIKFRKSNNLYEVVFKGGAISVIENVVYARDAERKWIQNYPVVCYEAYLLQRAVDQIIDKYGADHLFSYDALTEKGIELDSGFRISLLCDADIVFLMKNLSHEYTDEYFSRNRRRHPLWKTESEYKSIFGVGFAEKMYNELESEVKSLCKYLQQVRHSIEINDSVKQDFENDIERTEELINENPDKRANLEKIIASKRRYLPWIEALIKFGNKNGIKPDFLILQAEQFNSGFSNEALSKIKIEFDSSRPLDEFGKVTNVLKADKSSREEYFYLFYRKNDSDKDEREIDITDLAISFGKIALENIYRKRSSGFPDEIEQPQAETGDAEYEGNSKRNSEKVPLSPVIVVRKILKSFFRKP